MAFFRHEQQGLPVGAPRRLGEVVREHMPGADAETWRLVTAVAGLLACVAFADRDYTDTEEQAARQELMRVQGLEEDGVDAICKALRRDVADLARFGDQIWTREIKELGSRELRVDVLDALVALAAADNKLSLAETNYLRRLTTALGLTQVDYVALQTRYRDKLTFL